MKKFLIALLLLPTYNAISQNIGIGTSNPTGKLHVAGTDGSSDNLSIIVENPSDTALSSVNLKNGVAMADFSRYGGTSNVTVFGVSSAHLARIFNSGPILIAASGNSKLYFGTNDQIRMRFDENGLGAINAPISPTAQINIASNLKDAIYIINNSFGTNLSFGLNARIYSELGAAVVGSARPGNEFTSAFETGSYGIIGLAGNTGIGGGFFTVKGNALRTSSDSGLALHSSGKLRMQGINEGEGKVLTSDTVGNATWKSLPVNPIKSVFIHTASAGNITANKTTLTYDSPLATDILIVTPNLNPNGPSIYNNTPIGVSWTGSNWVIFNQTTTKNISVGASFNVMVMKPQ